MQELKEAGKANFKNKKEETSNFFTNQGENALYKKFVGVFEHRQNIEMFKSVIGYFRA